MKKYSGSFLTVETGANGFEIFGSVLPTFPAYFVSSNLFLSVGSLLLGFTGVLLELPPLLMPPLLDGFLSSFLAGGADLSLSTVFAALSSLALGLAGSVFEEDAALV